ncbi:MAG TPA: hypothetical protein VGB48_04980, partial [Allosphingosinicella sp.]
MTGKAFTAALLATALAAPAYAQDRSDALAAELAAMRAKISQLESEVAALKAKPVEAAPVAVAAAAAPAQAKRKESGGGGVTVKPFGRLQYDVAHVGRPKGLADRGLGFGHELRRGRIGLEGSIPGGFG